MSSPYVSVDGFSFINDPRAGWWLDTEGYTDREATPTEDALLNEIVRIRALAVQHIHRSNATQSHLNTLSAWLQQHPDAKGSDGWIMVDDDTRKYVARSYVRGDISAFTLEELATLLSPEVEP